MKTSLPILCVAALSLSALALAPILEKPIERLPAQAPVPLELGESHRVWGTVTEGLPNGRGVAGPRTNIAFIELASGLAYREAGQLLPAEEIIEAFPGGAIARRGAHKAIFGPNLATDPVEMEMPDGRSLRAVVRGLGYYDRASGKSVRLSEPQNCQGQIEGNNRVVYEGALGGGGGVRCDLAYTWRLSGVEQDVVIRECPPPADRFGLDPQTTVLEVITEFLDSPQPVRRADLGGKVPDEDLDFGPMRFGRGRAYVEGIPEPLDVPVKKQWLHVPQEGRSFLIEQMELPAVEEALSRLPAAEGASVEPAAGSKRYYASSGRTLPAAFKPTTASERKPMEMAAAQPARPGLVADWETIVNGGSFTFESGKTYYISGTVSLGAATISGNCTIKYTNNASLNVLSNLVLLTSATSPAMFTSCRDNTIGATIPGGTGNPVRLNATYLSHSQTNAFDYKHLRFRYAGKAIVNYVTPSMTVWHSQFIDCGTCVDTCYPAGGYVGRAIFYNVLMDNCSSDASSPGSVKVSGAQVTANAVQYLHGVVEWYAEPGSRYYYTNSIARDISNWVGTDPRQMEGGDYSDFSVTDSWEASPFTQVGAGRFYLPSGSLLRDAGVTNLLAALLSDLKATTTWGPVVLTPCLSQSNLVLSPQVQRETNRPDCGFHYPATDYALCGRYLTNASVTIQPGTTIAVYGTNGYSYGLALANASLAAEGTPSRPCRLVQYNLVQENTAGNWVPPSYALLTTMYSGSQMTLKFTHCSVMAEDTTHVFAWSGQPLLVEDCQFSGGLLDLEYPSLTLKNNVFDGVHSMFCPWDGNHTELRNNLFKGGTLDYLPYEALSEVKDNAFDRTLIADYSAEYGTYDGGYNAFINTTGRLMPTNVNDIVLSGFSYTNGPLGNYYHLSTNLVDRGSQAAALAGLYFHTTRATQSIEAGSPVDPGFHYVAVDANGEAVDTDGDGLADYEDPDADGDDLPDDWEITHFGDLSQDPGGDYDEDGATNLQEYNAGTDPNTISFFPRFASYHVASSVAGGSVEVFSGVPFQMACLVNSTNFAAAAWIPFAEDFTAPLNSGDGIYAVWVGMRGFSEDSEQTWVSARITRETGSCQVFLTDPTSDPSYTTPQPFVQIRGYTARPIASLHYDVANGAGSVADVEGFVTRQHFDTNALSITTNWFLCPDVPLATGTNTITLRVRDLAGNVSTTVCNYILDLANDHTPPVFTLYWPQDGSSVSAASFTLRGRVDDPSATVAAEISDSNGTSTEAVGVVERNGLLWVENLPLSAGANTLVLSTTDAAGNVSQTTLHVNRTDVGLTIDDVPETDLNAPNIRVTGAIASSDYSVWVNGVKAVFTAQDGEGGWFWEAPEVPVDDGGTAVIQARAIPNSVNGGDGSGWDTHSSNGAPPNPIAAGSRTSEKAPERDAFVFIQKYDLKYTQSQEWDAFQGEYFPSGIDQWWDTVDWTSGFALDSSVVNSGTRRHGYDYLVTDALGTSYDTYTRYVVTLPRDIAQPTRVCPFTVTSSGGTPGGSEPPPSIPQKVWEEDWGYAFFRDPYGYELGNCRRTEHAFMTLRTGGKAKVNRQNLFRIHDTWAFEFPRVDAPGQFVPVTSIQVLGEHLDADGVLWKRLPDNEDFDITPIIPAPRYTFDVRATKHKLVSECYSPFPVDKTRTEVGVGEYVDVSLVRAVPAPDVPTWETSAGSLSLASGSSTRLTAPSNALPTTVTVTVRGLPCSIGFGVREPTAIDHATITSTRGRPIVQGVPGAWMRLQVVIAPRTVSFYRVEIMEVGQPASSVTDYFIAHPPPPHGNAQGANVWLPVGYDNVIEYDFDRASYYGLDVMPPPWSPGGSFTWAIPAQWRIPELSPHPMSGWSQVFTLQSDGTMTITKFGNTVARHIDNTITPDLP